MMLRSLFMALGLLCVGLGVVGIFLPLLPTTPFLLLAAGCFARSSRRLEAWLHGNRRFGPLLADWQRHRVIRPRAKLAAASGMALGYGVFWLTCDPAPVLAAAVAAVMLGAAAYVLSRPSAPTPR